MQLIDAFDDADIEWLVIRLEKQKRAQDLYDEMRLVNAIIRAEGTKSKRGLTLYKQWHRQTSDEINRLARDESVWDRLKQARKSKTVFSRLKAAKRN